MGELEGASSPATGIARRPSLRIIPDSLKGKIIDWTRSGKEWFKGGKTPAVSNSTPPIEVETKPTEEKLSAEIISTAKVPEIETDSGVLSTSSLELEEIEEPTVHTATVIAPSREETSITTDVAQETVELPLKEEDVLFHQGKIDELLALRDNPDAQFNAFVLLLNQYRRFNPINTDCQRQLLDVNIDIIANRLGLTEGELQEYRTGLSSLNEMFVSNNNIREELKDREYTRSFGWAGKDPELEERIVQLMDQRRQLEQEMGLSIHTLLLPVRRNFLRDPALSERYKIEIVEGLSISSTSKHDSFNETEDTILKELYADPLSTVKIKELIKWSFLRRIGTDLHAIDIVPLEDLEKDTSGKNEADELFVATMGNPNTTAEFVETRLAPYFFPDRDSIQIRRAWESLANVTWISYGKDFREVQGVQRFGSDGANYSTRTMNKEFFLDFVDNADELIPVVNMLSDYGFNYNPTKWGKHDLVYSPEFVERLKELAKDKEGLKRDLDAVKAIYPQFMYRFHVEKASVRPGETTYIVEDNPYAIAFTDIIKNRDISSQAIQEGLRFLDHVPPHWQDTYIKTMTHWLIGGHIGANRDIEPTVLTEAIGTANTLLANPNVSEKTIRSIATEFLEASLRPQARNIEAAYNFLQKHADKVFLFIEEEWQPNMDHAWFKFVLGAGDLYRYELNGNQDEGEIQFGQRDFDFAYRALNEIHDPVLRDQAVEHMVIAYTDIDYINLDRARAIAESITDPNIRQRAQDEIELEMEREQRGETNAWKKLEKAKRVSPENIQFLIDLLGFGNRDHYEMLSEYTKKTGNYNLRAVVATGETNAAFRSEVDRIKDQVGVTVNITWERIKNLLQKGRAISIWENEELLHLRNKYGKYHYGQRRDEIERKMNNRAKGGARDPHPIFGAMWSPNDRNEQLGGAGGGYGECYLMLKTDRVRPRTTFTYDDSFDGFNDFPLTWEDAVKAKAMLNLTNHGSMHGYVEGQILGGVTLDDIEAIYIPETSIGKENALGYKTDESVYSEVEELRVKFPKIRFVFVEEEQSEKLAA